jgi:hypothetical protein
MHIVPQKKACHFMLCSGMRFQISSAWIVILEKGCGSVKGEKAMVFCAAYSQRKHARRTSASANSKGRSEEKKVDCCGDPSLGRGLQQMKNTIGNVTIYSSY